MLICPPVGGARRVTFALIGSLTFGACTTVSRPSGAQPVSAQAQQLIDEAWQRTGAGCPCRTEGLKIP
jgi:hypothetical protein